VDLGALCSPLYFDPVLISVSAVVAHFLPAQESVHRTLAVLVALFGTVALLIGFRKHR
jgi:hypothetical protein